ncbi:uncharacterized protein LOC122188158 isoform X3 [Lagopus leucura]|uniref:uncharacterized protein LOC122188158 isoform X3 n=1 Tax=Lagopus leucura TaxID=30410 RepID=UPI001C66BD91|nr:uncharacterized protein LOC122188158 isoform X3 [Lagopus leucura]
MAAASAMAPLNLPWLHRGCYESVNQQHCANPGLRTQLVHTPLPQGTKSPVLEGGHHWGAMLELLPMSPYSQPHPCCRGRSSALAYQQPLLVFAQPLRPQAPPPRTRFGAGSAQSRAAECPSWDGGRGREGGEPTAHGTEPLPALRGVWLPSAQPSDRAATFLQPLDGHCPGAAPADRQPPAPCTHPPDATAEYSTPPRTRGAAPGSPGAQLPHHGLRLAGGRGGHHEGNISPCSLGATAFVQGVMPELIQSPMLCSVPPQVLPRNLAVPFWEVSQALGLPPILTHADFVLANWRRKDPSGPLEIKNLEPIISLPGGESLRGFILVTLLVEKAAVPGIKATIQAIHALQHFDDERLHRALQELAEAIGDMDKALQQMHDYVDPAVFYTVIRIFLSGWRDNTAMPHGLLYEGVSEQPMAFSGGSAAQSSVLHAFDELLGIQHSQESSIQEKEERAGEVPANVNFLEGICIELWTGTHPSASPLPLDLHHTNS